MLGNLETYQLGRFFLSLIEVAALVAIGVGLLAAVLGVTSGDGLGLVAADETRFPVALTAMLPGCGLVLVGAFMMAWTQLSRARLDTAEMTRELLVRLGGNPSTPEAP